MAYGSSVSTPAANRDRSDSDFITDSATNVVNSYRTNYLALGGIFMICGFCSGLRLMFDAAHVLSAIGPMDDMDVLAERLFGENSRHYKNILRPEI